MKGKNIMTRKLASIQEILEIRAIPGADAIQHYRINDWWVVDKINQYKVGDIVVYCEIDSFIKTGEYTAFLSKGKEPKQYKGISGERLRTIKLRGALSQGLILPTAIIPDRVFTVEHIGEDVTDVLGIVKWELELPAQLAGQVNGTFPSYIPKTDQERCIASGTLIQTDHGLMTIDDIVNNHLSVNVLSYNHDTHELEYKPVVGWSRVDFHAKQWVKLETKSTSLICTSDHEVFDATRHYYDDAGDFSVGFSGVVQYDGENVWETEVIAVEYLQDDYFSSKLFDITVQDNHNFFANNILVHNCQNLKAQIFQTEDTWTLVQNDVAENTIQRLIAAGKFRYNADNVLERFTEAQAQPNAHYEVTMKMDGSSITNWFDPSKLEPCVASRNYELKVNDDNQGNAFVRMHIDSGLNQVLPIIFERTGIAYAVQGELMGAGIQGNREMLKFNQLFVFDVFNITEQRYLTPAERKSFMEVLYEFPQINTDIVLHAPIMHYDVTLAKLGLNDVQDLLNFAEGKSLVNPVREGVVFKRMDGKFSFKAISNTYLIQTKG